MINLEDHIIPKNLKVNDIIKKINKLSIKLLVVCDKKNFFLGTITDGDIRRIIIKKQFKYFFNFEASNLYNKKSIFIRNQDLNNKKILNKIKKKLYIPVVDKNKKLINILSNQETFNEKKYQNRAAIILAGGKGKRLRPLSYTTPKPLVEVQSQPNLLRIIRSLENNHFNEVIICANYQINKFKKFLRSYNFKLKISLYKEKKPLGTAGPIGNIKLNYESYLVLNSDLVFDIDYNDLYNFFRKSKSQITACVKQKSYQLPYGVVMHEKNKLHKIIEKPEKSFLFNAGIYIIKSDILKKIPKNKFLSMVDFINCQTFKNKKTSIFHIHESWLDIAKIFDLKKANNGN